jgi:hypothetical protein
VDLNVRRIEKESDRPALEVPVRCSLVGNDAQCGCSVELRRNVSASAGRRTVGDFLDKGGVPQSRHQLRADLALQEVFRVIENDRLSTVIEEIDEKL